MKCHTILYNFEEDVISLYLGGKIRKITDGKTAIALDILKISAIVVIESF